MVTNAFPTHAATLAIWALPGLLLQWMGGGATVIHVMFL